MSTPNKPPSKQQNPNQETSTIIPNTAQDPPTTVAANTSAMPPVHKTVSDLALDEIEIIYQHSFALSSPPQTIYTGTHLQNVSQPRLWGDVKTHRFLLAINWTEALREVRELYRGWIQKPLYNEHVFIFGPKWTRANIMAWQPPRPIDQYERVTVAVSFVGHIGAAHFSVDQMMQDVQDFIRQFISLRHLEVHWEAFRDAFGGLGQADNSRLDWEFGKPLKRHLLSLETVTFTVGKSWDTYPFPNQRRENGGFWTDYPRDYDALMRQFAEETRQLKERERIKAARRLRAKAGELIGSDFSFYHDDRIAWEEDGHEELRKRPGAESKKDFKARIVAFQQKRAKAKLENEVLARRRAAHWVAKATLRKRRAASLDDDRTSRGEDVRIARLFGSKLRSRPVETDEQFLERNPRGGDVRLERHFGSRVRSRSEDVEEKSAAEFYRWSLERGQGSGRKRRRLS